MSGLDSVFEGSGRSMTRTARRQVKQHKNCQQKHSGIHKERTRSMERFQSPCHYRNLSFEGIDRMLHKVVRALNDAKASGNARPEHTLDLLPDKVRLNKNEPRQVDWDTDGPQSRGDRVLR